MARSIWTGTISFGLVSVPIRVFSAIEQKDIHFRQIDEKTKSRVRYKRVAEKTGREVPYSEIQKGYEIEEGEYVLLDRDELEELEPETTRTIDIEDFVSLEEIDPIYYEHTYYLAPDTGGEKAYWLLQRALRDSGKVGIGRVVMRGKQYLAAIRPYERALAMETMLFHDEVRSLDEIEDIPDRSSRVSSREMSMARQLIDALSAGFDPSKYEDTYRERLLAYIEKKARGETVEITEVEPERPTVRSLLDALQKSVERTRGKDGGDEPLAEATVTELRERARELGVSGRSKMSKRELIRALERAS